MGQPATSFVNFVPLPKHRVKALVAAGWARVIAGLGDGGKQRFADGIDTSSRTVEYALAGNTLPEAHTLLNSLLVDPTALSEVLAALGFQLVPSNARASDDLSLASGLTEVTGDLIRNRGRRSPRDTLILADKLRPIIAEEEAIVREADTLRGLN